MSVQIYRPDGETGQAPASLAPSPGSLSGLRIAVLDNGKPNAAFVMTPPRRVARRARAGAEVTVVLKKGPRGESANAAIPCDPEIFDRVVAEADIVI